MVHKKYTYKDGKRFGPYYYETKRINGHVVTTYLGTKLPHKKIHLSLIKNILILSGFILLIASVYFISSNITGNVSLDIKTNYNYGEQITGSLNLNVFQGELIPADSIIFVSYGNYSAEFLLSDLISDSLLEGEFYADGVSLSGEGSGYGLIGSKIEYPQINFEFSVEENDDSTSLVVEEEPSQEAEVPVEISEETEPAEESESSESFPITGAVISDSNTVSGTVSKDNDFSYSLSEGEDASLVRGSVFYENEQLEDGVIDFSVNDNEVIVTTDYSVEMEGFGSDYIGDESKIISINLDSLGLVANSESELRISLIYDNSIIVEASEEISVSNIESSISVESPETSGSGFVSNETTNEIFVNETVNETQIPIINQTTNETFINENLTVETVQYGAVIGRPVRWVKTVSLESEEGMNLTVEIPASAENISVNRITNEEKIENAEIISGEIENDITIGITGEVTADFNLERESFIQKLFKLFRITGNVIEEESEVQEISVELYEQDIAVEVEYYTDAPIAVESVVHENFKTVYVSSPEDVHYENVLVYTNIVDGSKIRDISSIMVEWVENDSLLNVSSFEDTNSDGYIDYIEWIAPHLSNQTFNIILIISALHLDENRSFISDIFNETRELDNVWSESIPNSHYVRVTFETNLTNVNDITIFPRVSSENVSQVTIDIFEKDSNLSIAQFSNLNENNYNKIYLTNLVGSQDTFDLLISGGDIEFDHIIDPTTRLNGPAGDVDIIPINNFTFVVAYINFTGNNTQFSVMNPNGTTVTGPITVQTASGTYSRVSLATINETSFAIGWVNQSSADELSATYYTNGTRISAPTFWDGAIGSNRYDIGLTQIGNRYGYCYVDQAEGDVDFSTYFNNGTRLSGFGELDIDTGSTPEKNRGNVVDCVAVNATTFATGWYDAGGTDDILVRFLNNGATNISLGPIRNLDSAVGTTAALSMATLDSNRTVIAFYDNADQDITITIIGHNNITYVAATDIQTAAGIASSVDVAAISNGTMDSFVVVWYNKSTEDIVARSFRGNGTAYNGEFRIETDPQNYTGTGNANTTFPLFAVAGKDSITGQSLCPNTFVVSYTNVSNASLLKSFWTNGSEWDGQCGEVSIVYPTFGPFNESPVNNSAYINNALYRFNITISDSNGTAGLEFDGLNRTVTNLTATMFNSTLSNLGAGTYSYYWWSYGLSNTYNTSGLRNYVVARNSTPLVNLTLNGTQQQNIYIGNGSGILLNGTLLLGDSTATLRLFKNGTIINEGITEVSNLTNFSTVPGLFNITVLYNQSQNYTQGSRTYNVTVLPGNYKTIQLVDDVQEATNGGGGGSELIIESYIVTAPADILIVQIVNWGIDTGVIPVSVDYGGSELVRVGNGAFSSTNNVAAEVYYLVDPPVDNTRITITLGGSGALGMNAAAFTLSGVNMTEPIDNSSLYNSSATDGVFTNITTTTHRDWLVDALGLSTISGTPESLITQTLNQDTGTSIGGFKQNVNLGLNNMTWTWSGTQPATQMIAAFRPAFVDDFVDNVAPNVTLNSPANSSVFNLSAPIYYNWTARDYFDTSMLCNLTINGVINRSNVVSPNNTATNVTVLNTPIGAYLWNVTCLDDLGNSGFNGTRLLTVYNLLPYNGTAVRLNTTLETNRTSENLSVMTTLLDLNNHTMNVTVRWYNESILHLTENYNNNYVNGSTFIALLGHGNTTKGHNWTANLTVSDGYNGTIMISNNLSIVDSPPNVTIVSPLNNSVVNYTDQNYTWVMGDDDPPEFVAVVAINFSSLAVSSCADPTFSGDAAHIIPTAESYYFTGAVQLECPFYLWTVGVFSTVLGASETFRINATGNIPNVTLNSPSNSSSFVFGNDVGFNWTSRDNPSAFSANSTCNLTIDNAVNISNVNSTNGVGTNVSANFFPIGFHHWNVTCVDFVGNTNFSITRTFNITNEIYNGTRVNLTSTLGLNRTLENLTTRTNLMNLNNWVMNVTVRWYNNSVLHLIDNYNNNYVNGTLFNATLAHGNTTRGHNWTAAYTISDGRNTFSVNSTPLMIRNTPPNITMLTPGNNSITLNRTNQNFTWIVSDDDGDAITAEEINISVVAASSCTDPIYNGDEPFGVGETGPNNFDLAASGSGPLNCLIDNGDFYLWSPRAYDDLEAGPYPPHFRFDVQAYLNFVMNISTVDFGNLAYLRFNDTSDNSPKPIIIINEGNVKSDISFGASSLWKSVNNPSIYYTAKVDNASTNGISENGTFLASSSLVSYTNVPLTASPISLAISFNYRDHIDTIEVDLNATVPNTEGPGFKNSTITFTLVLANEESPLDG